jgi:hypothetical protein
LAFHRRLVRGLPDLLDSLEQVGLYGANVPGADVVVDALF